MTRARYEVRLKPSAERALTKLQKNTQQRIVDKLTALATDPRPPGSEKLAGEKDLYRVRTGDYRILYTVHDDRLMVLVVAIGHRREVYR